MAADWKTLTIEDCMTAIIDYRGKTPEKTIFGVPLVTAKVIKGGRIEKPDEFIAEADYNAWMRRGMPMRGDVVMTTEAPLGEVAQLDGAKVALAQRVITLRGKPDLLDNTFLKFLLQSSKVQEELRSRSTGTTVVGIRQSELRKVSLTFPPIAKQRTIAHILGTLDDKIELNRRMNETLEGMARAVFKSWFVDFDPVRAKAEGRAGKAEGGRRKAENRLPSPSGRGAGGEGLPALPKHIADLFPDSFQDSELGKIPKGWKVRSLPEMFEINPKRSLSKGVLAPYLDMGNMPTQGPSPESWAMREMGSGMKFVNGDTLVARITPCLENGKTAFVDFLANGEVGWGSTEYIVLRPKGAIPPIFAYLLARTDDFRTFAVQQMTGSSGRQRVPADSLDKYRIPAPKVDSPIFQHFGELVSPMFGRIRAAMGQSRTLAALRDTLLPKLLSGEIRVGEASKIVEGVA